MTTEVLLDTNVCIALIKGETSLVSRLDDMETTLIPSTVLGELLCGMPGYPDNTGARKSLDDFLSVIHARIVPITEKTALAYAQIFTWLKTQGTPLPTNDIWIAASAMEHGVPLATNDRHFKKIPHIILI